MRRLILIFLVVIGVGGAAGASASDDPGYGAGEIHPPSLPSDVTCTGTADWNSCFYPAHDR